MSMELGPQPLRSVIRDHVEDQRDLFCSSYDACLGRAAHEDWTSWTCTHCARFRPRREDGRSRRRPGVAACTPAAGRQAGARVTSPSSRPQDREIARARAGPRVRARPELPSGPALFVAAARAVAGCVRGRPLEASAGWEEEVSIAAPDSATLLAAWIDELTRRSLASRVRFDEVDVVHVSDRRLVAFIRGVRLEGARDLVDAVAHDERSRVAPEG